MMTGILMLGQEQDRQIQHIVDIANHSNIKAIVVDTTCYSDIGLAWYPVSGTGIISIKGKHYSLDEFSAFYWQRFYPPKGSAEQQQWVSSLSPLFLHNTDKWFNPIHATRFHQSKPMQLAHAKALGAIIPLTQVGVNMPLTAPLATGWWFSTIIHCYIRELFAIFLGTSGPYYS